MKGADAFDRPGDEAVIQDDCYQSCGPIEMPPWIDANGVEHSVEIWDTSGQEALPSFRRVAYPDTDIFLFIFDMTDAKSLLSARTFWFDDVKAICSDYKGIVLVGLQFDLFTEKLSKGATDNLVGLDAVKEAAEELNAASLICVSTQTGYGIVQPDNEGRKLPQLLMDITNTTCNSPK